MKRRNFIALLFAALAARFTRAPYVPICKVEINGVVEPRGLIAARAGDKFRTWRPDNGQLWHEGIALKDGEWTRDLNGEKCGGCYADFSVLNGEKVI